MEIKIGYGIGNFIFGMQRENVLSLLGQPDARRALEEYGDLEEEWCYNEQRMSFRFDDHEEGRLIRIESENEKITLLKKPIIGKQENEVAGLMKASGFDDYEYEDYTSFRMLDYKDNWVEFESVFGRIKRVEISAFIDDDDQYVWRYTT